MTEAKKWVLVRDTILATEVHPKVAGRMFNMAGFEKAHLYNEGTGRMERFVDAKAEYLTKAEIQEMAGHKSKAEKKAGAGPSYFDLVQTIEKQDRLIHELRDEIRQLRQHVAPNNGLSDRAKRALKAANQTLDLYKEN